jgi:hypothetical protein
MKKILLVVATSMMLAACGGNSNQSEANRDADEMESNDPSVNADDAEDDMTDDDRRMGRDSTMNNSADTTATTSPGVGAAPSN